MTVCEIKKNGQLLLPSTTFISLLVCRKQRCLIILVTAEAKTSGRYLPSCVLNRVGMSRNPSPSPSPSRYLRSASEPAEIHEAYIPDEVTDSLALHSYLKLRHEQRSPHNQSVRGRELYEEFRFDENGSAEEDFTEEINSDKSLSFTDHLDSISELDYKAMRLLVHTSVHEKEIAQSKVTALDNEIARLKAMTLRYTSPSTWKLPVAIVKLYSARVTGRKTKLFNVWKAKTLKQKLAAVFSERQQYLLKVARRNILKVRQTFVCRAFQRWSLQVRHAAEALVSYETKTTDRHKTYLTRALFKRMRGRRLQRQTLRQMNRILRAVQYRFCFAHWRGMTTAYYRTRLLKLQQTTSVASIAQALVQSRSQLKNAFAVWATGARGQRNRQKLASLTHRCFGHVIRRHANPLVYAFQRWRHVATVLFGKLRTGLIVWTEAVRKTTRHAQRLAMRKWREHCVRFKVVTKRIAAYLAAKGQLSVREGFNRLVAAQSAYLRGKLKERTEQWVRKFFQSADATNELTCRSVLSKRFHHWHHATHTERNTTRFQGELEQIHAALVRTKSDLHQEASRKRAADEEAQRREAHLHSHLVKSRFRGLGKIIGSMLHRQTAKAFRSWGSFCKWQIYQQDMAARQLQHHRKQAQATIQRWAQYTGNCNLSTAFSRWRTVVHQMGSVAVMVLRRERVIAKRVLHGWQVHVHENHVQRRCIKRMVRRKGLAAVGLAWETWTRRVAKLRQTCKTFVKMLLNKRRNSVQLSFRRWRHAVSGQVLHEEKTNRARLEEAERALTLRLHWSHFQLGVEMFRRDKRHMIQIVVGRILSRVRSGFDKWFHFSQRQSKLRSICIRMTRHYAHSLGKQHFLAFARWKAVVWDYQKVCYQDLQEQLADAHDRIVNITEQQLVLESNSQHLRAHNERADRIARTLYHQVHRMLSSRRLYGTVKLVFDTWKQNHEFIKRCKLRLKQYLIRSHATAATLEVASAFRSWVVVVQALRRGEEEMDTAARHARMLTLHRYFALWQTYRTVRRMQMMVSRSRGNYPFSSVYYIDSHSVACCSLSLSA
jgi:hypothetical protein